MKRVPFSAMEPTLLVDRDGPIVTVTMNRPQRKNAFDLEMLARMADAWQMVDEDDEIRVAILTGAGGDFSSGADLKMMHGNNDDDPFKQRFVDDPELHWKALLRNQRIKKPLIAAVEGIALGGGTEILQGTDIRVAGESARFGVTEARWGLFPLGGSTVRLASQISYTRAMELLLMARPITAADAKDMGLIGRVVPDGSALDSAKQMASVIAENGPLAVQAIKRSVLATRSLAEADALKLELEIGQPIFATKDAREGPRAFAERRKPDFKSH
jgi:enoyl-CoA hydratase